MNRLRVGIVGCGIVGAAIAYELSKIPDLEITVLDRRSPQTWQATGAALGVLMAAIGQKLKGRALQLRLSSLQRYETLIPELEQLTGLTIPYNRQGILRLCFDPAELDRWQQVQAVRSQQGFPLEILDLGVVQARHPAIAGARSLETGQSLTAAIYSPTDRQVHPVKLAEALIQAAQQQGVRFQFQTTVRGFKTVETPQGSQLKQIQTDTGSVAVEWLILAAGLGSTQLSQVLTEPVEVRPVLGQALHLRSVHPFSFPRPVISGEDVHLVPLSSEELWVGATVEFPPEVGIRDLQADPSQLNHLWQQAIALCPSLNQATILDTWSGLRPRPCHQPAPVIGFLGGYQNVLLATGHYRNGVLLAPITALKIQELLNIYTQ